MIVMLCLRMLLLFTAMAAAGFGDVPLGSPSSHALAASYQLAGLRCEWRINPHDVPDPCPEFSWETPARRSTTA
ncbi:MAG: hypothetical protein GXY83_28995 [Rhodopirellula sp.]|nr:hypothetical protein [Rhodopirellula sp.]